jgi:diguanylate cyclase (GGDEF)-like protein/PAS domain S-box-containing protein
MHAAQRTLDLPQPIESKLASSRAVPKLFLILYVPLAIALTSLVYGILKTDVDIQLQTLRVQEAGEVRVATRILGHDFGDVASDLLFLSKTPALKLFIDNGLKEEKQRVVTLFLNMAQEKRGYDQIRYINDNGMEAIRINLVDGKAVVVAGAELQNKSGRYFFRDALRLSAGEVYVSPMDLNIEHGKIELPHKPIVRFATPVFDSAGKKKGVVFIHYLGDELLDDFRRAMVEKRHAMLLNQDGYWLSNPDPAQEWGFMFGQGNTFAKTYPDAWEKITQQEKGELLTAAGLFTYDTVHPLLASQHASNGSMLPSGMTLQQANFWKIVSFVPAAEMPSIALASYPRTYAIYAASMLLLAALSLYLAITMASRRQLRAAMFENEARLREITTTLGEGVYVTDSEGYITYANPETERLLGWTHEELIGQHGHNLFHYQKTDGTLIPASDCEILLATQTGQAYRGDDQIFWRKDGSPLPVNISASPIVRDGMTMGSVVAFSDITERKRAEDAMLNSEAQLKGAQSLAHLGSWELDLVSQVLVWSDEMYRIFEIAPAAFGASYEAFLNAIHPEDRERVNRAYSESVKNHTPYSTEHRLLFPDGHIKFVHERGETYYGAEGRPIRSIGTAQDITERKQAEEERFQAEVMFHMVFDNVGDAIFIHGINGNFLEANLVASERLGYTRYELLRLSPSDINTSGQEAKFAERDKVLLAQGRIVFETVHITKDGQKIPVEVSARLIDFSGKPAILSVARDIAERKAAEKLLRQSEETARTLLNATSESAMLVDANGIMLAINEIGAKNLRKQREEIIGHDFFAFLPPALAKTRMMILREVIESGQSRHFHDVRDGIHFESDFFPVLDTEGKVGQVAIYAADVTEQMQLQAVDTLFHEIDQQVLHGLPIQGLMQFVCDEVVRLLDYPLAWIGKKEADGSVSFSAWSGVASGYQVELARIGVRWDETPQGKGPVGMTIKTGHKQVFNTSDPGFHAWREASQRFNLNTSIGIPLIIRGEIYGAFSLYSEYPQSFDDLTTAQRIASIASRICVALETAMDQEQLRLLGTALSTAGNGVFITDRRGYIQWINAAFTRLSGFTAKEALGRTPAILKSGKQDSAYYRHLWQTIQRGDIWSSETVEQHKDGTLFNVQQTVTPIRDGEGEISHFISILEDITAQKKTEAKIQRMAHYDGLTDLPNRALFYDRLRQVLILAKRDRHMSALMFLDLDRFKTVNDTLGHHVGDLLLQEVAVRLKACVRESDTVARLAGDEFTVLLPHVEKHEDAAAVAEKIIAALAEPFLLDGREVHSGGSMGIAVYPEDASDDEALIKCADTAMYIAKKKGRGTFCFYQQTEA